MSPQRLFSANRCTASAWGRHGQPVPWLRGSADWSTGLLEDAARRLGVITSGTGFGNLVHLARMVLFPPVAPVIAVPNICWGCSQQGHHQPSFLLQDHVRDVDKKEHEASANLLQLCKQGWGQGTAGQEKRERAKEKGDRGKASRLYPGVFGHRKLLCSEGFSAGSTLPSVPPFIAFCLPKPWLLNHSRLPSPPCKML